MTFQSPVVSGSFIDWLQVRVFKTAGLDTSR